MRKYLLKFFLTCKVFFDFLNKYAKNIMKINMCAKIVVISYLVCENVVKFFTNIEIDSTFLSPYDKIFKKIFTNYKIGLIFKKELLF